MDKIKQIMANAVLSHFDEIQSILTLEEQEVIKLYYIKDYKIHQIATEINYSEAQVNRLLKSARKKINCSTI